MVSQDFRTNNLSKDSEELEKSLEILVKPLKNDGLLAVSTLIEANHFLHGISVVTQSLKGMPLPPNIMFLTMSDNPDKDERLKQLISMATNQELGLIVLNLFEDRGFGHRKDINMWLRGGSPNRNLSILTAIQLEKNWNGQLRLLRLIDDEAEINKARIGLQAIARRGRLPIDCEKIIFSGTFPQGLEHSPPADINIFGISNNINIKTMHKISSIVGTTCLFIRDSGEESVLA